MNKVFVCYIMINMTNIILYHENFNQFTEQKRYNFENEHDLITPSRVHKLGFKNKYL
jgi:hypothetical protein